MLAQQKLSLPFNKFFFVFSLRSQTIFNVIETEFFITNIKRLCNTLTKKVPLTEGMTFCANFNQPPPHSPHFSGLLAIV